MTGLRPDPARPALAHHASRGTVLTFGGQWGRTALQLVSTLVLARLLTPADFGLVAMVTAIVGVAELVREFGLTGAIVREREIDESSWAALYRFSFGLALGIALLTAAAAPLIAALYGEPRLIGLTVALAPAVLFNGIAMPLQARLQRQLRFGQLALADVVSMAVGVAGAVTAATLGAGVWSLVLLTGLAALYRAVAMAVIVRPTLRGARRVRELLPLISTGGSIFGVQLLNYAARNLDNVIIGRWLGPTALGFYSRAYALLMMPISQLNGPLARVGVPVLGKLQDEPEAFRRYVRTAMLVLGYAALPTFALAAAVAGPLVEVLLGAGWAPVAPLFALLCLAGAAQALGNVSGWLYVALGRAHRQLVWFAATKPLVIASFPVGLWLGGLEGLALAYGVVSCALLVPGFAVATRGTFVTLSDSFAPVLRPALLCPFVFGAAALVVALVPGPAILTLPAGVAAGVLVAGAALLIPAYRADLSRLSTVIASARRPR